MTNSIIQEIPGGEKTVNFRITGRKAPVLPVGGLDRDGEGMVNIYYQEKDRRYFR